MINALSNISFSQEILTKKKNKSKVQSHLARPQLLPAPVCDEVLFCQSKTRSNTSLSSHRDGWKNSALTFAANVKEIINTASFGRSQSIVIGDGERTQIPKNNDGGYLLDTNTNTVAYFGQSAIEFLNNTSSFKHETEIILPEGGDFEVDIGNKTLSSIEEGVFLVAPGTSAKVKVNAGMPVVITTEKPPAWYVKMSPDGIHKSVFDELIQLNKHLLSGHVLKDLLTDKEIQVLLKNNIAELVDERYLKFKEYKSKQCLAALKKTNLSAKEVDKIFNIWLQTKIRQLQNLESGSFSESEISPALASKLIEEKILVQLSPSIKSDLLFWGYYFTEEELSKKLNKLGLTEKENMQIVDLWGKTTRAGYDTTGLALEDKGVVFYSWHKKCNIWTQHMTEWLVNSQSYPGQGEPFTTGISKVQASKDYKKPIPFKEIRPGEALHRHPDREDRNQTEVYCVTSGEAALLTIEKGKPVINKLKAGDMAVIQPGVTHCVIAVKGRYEHTVFQIPSAFQYGFMLKETVDYKDFDTTEEEITKIALNKLA